MKRGNLVAATVLMGCALLGTGCDTASINTSDNTNPIVEVLVKQGNGQYEVANQAVLGSGGQVKVLCRVRDPDGVKQAKLTFQGGASNSCTVNGAIFSGVFSLQPPLPGAMVQDIFGSNGKVPTVLPLFADVNSVTCTVPGQPQPGIPFGHTITANCEGTNWSSNASKSTASAKLQIKVQ